MPVHAQQDLPLHKTPWATPWDTASPKHLHFHRGSDQPLLLLNFNPFTNAELLKLNLCFIWTQQLQRLQGRDLNSTLFISNPSVFTKCLQGYTAHVSNLPSYSTGIIGVFLNMQIKYPLTSAKLCTSQLWYQMSTKYCIYTLFQHNPRIAHETNRGKEFYGSCPMSQYLIYGIAAGIAWSSAAQPFLGRVYKHL